MQGADTLRLFDFIRHQAKKYPLAESIGSQKDGVWKYYSTQEVIEKATAFSCGLLKLGVKPKDKIAVITYANRAEWAIADLGIQQIGAITVPVYPTISPSEYEYIFNDSEVKYCFLGKDDLYDKVSKAQENTPSLLDIYTFDKVAGRNYWEDIFTTEGKEEVERIMATVNSKDLATLIYTSGTTGKPKGVMLSHFNLASNVVEVEDVLPIKSGETALSFLPLCHVFERCASYAYQYSGIRIAFTGVDNLGGEEGDLQSVKPHFFTTVPRLLEKVYEKIYGKGRELTGIKKGLFFWALGLTEDYTYDKKYTGFAKIKRQIADKLIFSKWRDALGGNIKGIFVGAAPCPVKIAQVFSAAGIPVREGYGLTETSPGLTFNRFDDRAELGCAGIALDSVNMLIDASEGEYNPEEGEILVTGPNVMMGYYNRPDANASVFKEIDGVTWFRTGDVGKLVERRGHEFLKITDRKKELLKTSGGKYVAPAPIENKLKEDFLVEQIMIVGNNKKFVSALIIPAKEAFTSWCEIHNVPTNDYDAALKDERVLAKYQKIIDAANPNFSKVEQIKKFILINSEWEATKADGSEAELTPTMKLKRRVVLSKYEKEINDIYNV